MHCVVLWYPIVGSESNRKVWAIPRMKPSASPWDSQIVMLHGHEALQGWATHGLPMNNIEFYIYWIQYSTNTRKFKFWKKHMYAYVCCFCTTVYILESPWCSSSRAALLVDRRNWWLRSAPGPNTDQHPLPDDGERVRYHRVLEIQIQFLVIYSVYVETIRWDAILHPTPSFYSPSILAW